MRAQNVWLFRVCDEGRQVLVTITDRDVALRLVADDRPASTLVEQLMTREVVASKPGDDVREAERLMGDRTSRAPCASTRSDDW